MRGPSAFLNSYATGRNILTISLVAAVMWLRITFLLIPTHRDVTGFVPFDVQVPLSRFTIGIEPGVFARGAAASQSYVVFAAIDWVRGVILAGAFVLLWSRLFVTRPTSLSRLLSRGGILLVPLYVVVLDTASKIAFVRLVRGVTGSSYGATIEFAALAHWIEFSFIDLRNYLTAAFVVIAMVDFVVKRSAQKTGP